MVRVVSIRIGTTGAGVAVKKGGIIEVCGYLKFRLLPRAIVKGSFSVGSETSSRPPHTLALGGIENAPGKGTLGLFGKRVTHAVVVGVL